MQRKAGHQRATGKGVHKESCKLPLASCNVREYDVQQLTSARHGCRVRGNTAGVASAAN